MAGQLHALAIHADGTLWAAGDNSAGQLGTGNTTSQSTWVQVGSATNWVRVAAGGLHSLGLRADGTLWAWGDNTYGQLGNASNTTTATPNPTPTQVAGTYTHLAAGTNHSLALQADGIMLAWGNNGNGQLGIGSLAGTTTPTQEATLATS